MKTTITFHDFFLAKKTPAKEKKAIMKKVIKRANEMQRETVKRASVK